MKHLTLRNRIAVWLTVLGGNVTTVWAADTVREDNSGLFVWIFLAFCALIVVAQLIPAIMMLMGLARGIKDGRLIENRDDVKVNTGNPGNEAQRRDLEYWFLD